MEKQNEKIKIAKLDDFDMLTDRQVKDVRWALNNCDSAAGLKDYLSNNTDIDINYDFVYKLFQSNRYVKFLIEICKDITSTSYKYAYSDLCLVDLLVGRFYEL